MKSGDFSDFLHDNPVGVEAGWRGRQGFEIEPFDRNAEGVRDNQPRARLRHCGYTGTVTKR